MVRSGDSLSGIAAKLYGDAARWKELWKMNLFIKNPHCIYPDQILRLIALGPETLINQYPADAMNKGNRSSESSPMFDEIMAEGEEIPKLLDEIGPSGSMRTYPLEMLLTSLLNDVKPEESEQEHSSDSLPPASIRFPVMSLIFNVQADSLGSRKYLVGNSTAYVVKGDHLQPTNTRPAISPSCDRSRAVAEIIDQYGRYLNVKRTEDEWLIYTKWMVLKDDLRYYAFLFTNVNKQGENFFLLRVIRLMSTQS